MLRSSGSVLLFFQPTEGRWTTVTDRHAERYIMLVPEQYLVVKSTLIASRKPEILYWTWAN